MRPDLSKFRICPTVGGECDDPGCGGLPGGCALLDPEKRDRWIRANAYRLPPVSAEFGNVSDSINRVEHTPVRDILPPDADLSDLVISKKPKGRFAFYPAPGTLGRPLFHKASVFFVLDIATNREVFSWTGADAVLRCKAVTEALNTYEASLPTTPQEFNL